MMLTVFESDVILYGGQTLRCSAVPSPLFESDVILYGGQTETGADSQIAEFESDVILYGGQTRKRFKYTLKSV